MIATYYRMILYTRHDVIIVIYYSLAFFFFPLRRRPSRDVAAIWGVKERKEKKKLNKRKPRRFSPFVCLARHHPPTPLAEWFFRLFIRLFIFSFIPDRCRRRRRRRRIVFRPPRPNAEH